jgi:two-component system sensor histidine kinase KdpD
MCRPSCRCCVHAALIEQALVNVLENAARFSPPHGRCN